MKYMTALRRVHRIIRPKNYVEIGCARGESLALSRSPTVAIDPRFTIRRQLVAPTRLFRMTSDEFFARKKLPKVLRRPVDCAFIDGMHLAEYALRDFNNLERSSHAHGIIMIDDVLPARIGFATRARPPGAWTGDVYRVIAILKEYRPDLDIRVYDVDQKGFCLVSRLDPNSTVLEENRASIEADIDAERWILSSVEEIRALCDPISPDELRADLERLAAWRAAADGDPVKS